MRSLIITALLVVCSVNAWAQRTKRNQKTDTLVFSRAIYVEHNHERFKRVALTDASISRLEAFGIAIYRDMIKKRFVAALYSDSAFYNAIADVRVNAYPKKTKGEIKKTTSPLNDDLVDIVFSRINSAIVNAEYLPSIWEFID